MPEINTRAIFFIVAIFILGIAIVITHFANVEQQKINDEILAEQKAMQNNQSTVTIINPITPQPTGTPFIMYSPQPIPVENLLEINQSYHYHDTDAAGKVNLNVSAVMYGFKEITDFTYYDRDWGLEFNETAPLGQEYFLAFFHLESEQMPDGKAVSFPLPPQSNFALEVDNQLYQPVQLPYLSSQIRALDNTWDYHHVEEIQPYGYSVESIPDNVTGVPVLTEVEDTWLMAGQSNAEDGYIIFQIPTNYNPRSLKFIGNFWSFGQVAWVEPQ